MYESRLRKRKVKEPEEELQIIEKETTTKKLKTVTKKTNSANKKKQEQKKTVKEVELALETSNEPDLDFTKTCPNEIIIYILSFLTYKEVLCTFYDKRWLALSNSKEVWGTFCRKMRWTLPINNKKMTYKDLYKKRICSKSFCCSCGSKTSAKFPLLQITLCPSCRNTDPEYATLNKTQSKAQYFLDEYDLSKVKFHISNVGWGRKKYVYLKSDIEAAAFQKFGGKAAFEQERDKRTQAKQNKLNMLTQKKERRAQDLEGYLASIGWHKTFAVGPRNFPILLPSELLNDDYDRFLRAPEKGNPTNSFGSIFVLNCHRYMNTGFGAMFKENMSLVDDIERYFLRERAANPSTDDGAAPATSTTSTNSTNSTTSTTSTTNTTTSTTSTTSTDVPPTSANSIASENNNNNNNNNSTSEKKSERKMGVAGTRLATFAGATFDAELRKFYVSIIYARIGEIWQHPGRFDIEPEVTGEDDHMGVLFDKKAHFTKRLLTPNHILEQIYDDAVEAMSGGQYDSDFDEFDDSDSDDDGFGIIPFDFFNFGGFGGCACLFGHNHLDDDDDDSDSDSDI